MKTISKTLIASLSLLMAMSGHVMAQTLETSGDIGTATNWSGSTLPTNSLSPGTIAINGTVSGSVTYDGLFIEQTAGNITQLDQGGDNYTFTDGSYTMTGGTWGTRRGLTVGSGQTFSVDGGTFGVAIPGGGGDGPLQISTGGTFTLNSGSVTVSTDSVTVNGGSLIVNGGNFTAVSNFGNASFNAAALDVSFNGGTISLGSMNFGKASAVSFGNGTAGTVTVIGAISGVTAFDWASTSLMKFTVSGADTAFYEGLWTAGDLLVDGVQTGEFSDNFTVNGSTLSIIPEPSAFVLMGLAGLAAMLLRRRK